MQSKKIRAEKIQFAPQAEFNFGLIALSTDLNSENEFHRTLPENVHLFTNRVINHNPVTMHNLAEMQNNFSETVQYLVPNIELDVIMYGCTSGTIAIGHDKLQEIVSQHRKDTPFTNPVAAVGAALYHLEISEISILNPYTRLISDVFCLYFQDKGIEVTDVSYMGLDDDSIMSNITPGSLKAMALTMQHAGARALFIPCTAINTLKVIRDIEKILNIPVITSNQAMLWHAISLIKKDTSKIYASLSELGYLFQQANNKSSQ